MHGYNSLPHGTAKFEHKKCSIIIGDTTALYQHRNLLYALLNIKLYKIDQDEGCSIINGVNYSKKFQLAHLPIFNYSPYTVHVGPTYKYVEFIKQIAQYGRSTENRQYAYTSSETIIIKLKVC